MSRPALLEALRNQPRVRLASLPTPLEWGPRLPGGARLLVKRDDLSGLGMGGNKARKLEFLCAAAQRAGADTLVSVGGAQSNHARMTAAAGAVLGLDAHLVLGGPPPKEPAGNQLLAHLFGAYLHYPGSEDWTLLERHAARLAAELEERGRRPYLIPMGGSTAVGACGFALAWTELAAQCDELGVRPRAIVHASSTGGTHAGLLAGQAVWRQAGWQAPQIVAVAVAKTDADLAEQARALADACLKLLGLDVRVDPAEVHVAAGWQGPGYAVPTDAADAAIVWAARHGGWVLDRVYTSKAFAAVLGLAEAGRFGPDDTVVFWHTGGQPAVFAPDGLPPTIDTAPREEVT